MIFLSFFFGKNYYFITGLVLPTIFLCCHMVLTHVLTKVLKSILSAQKRGRQQVLSGQHSSVILQSDWWCVLTPDTLTRVMSALMVTELGTLLSPCRQATQMWVSAQVRPRYGSYLPVLSDWLHCTSNLSWHCGPWRSMINTERKTWGSLFRAIKCKNESNVPVDRELLSFWKENLSITILDTFKLLSIFRDRFGTKAL